MKNKLLIVFPVIVLLQACQPDWPKESTIYGVEYDTARKRMGLPTLEANNMKIDRAGRDYTEFKAEEGLPNPKLEYKSIFWQDSCGMYLERNFFRGPHNEELHIYYGYKKMGDWEHLGFGYAQRKGDNDDWTSIEKQQADSVLNSWGLKIK